MHIHIFIITLFSTSIHIASIFEKPFDKLDRIAYVDKDCARRLYNVEFHES